MGKFSLNLKNQARQAVLLGLGALFLGVMTVASQADTTGKKLSAEPMSAVERQSWATAMFERLDRANRVVLDPKYVILQRNRFEKQVRPFLLGTSPEESRKIVKTVRDEVENVERVAIEHLDRQFRQALDKTFSRPADQTLRQQWFEGWQKTVQAWQKSTDQVHQLHGLLTWLQKSKTSLEGKQYATVTPVPRFLEPTIAQKTKTPTVPDTPVDKRRVPPEIPPGLAVDPSEDRTLPSQYVVKKPIEPAGQRPTTPPGKPDLEVNLSELNAQIRGNNLALRRLETKLVTDKTWTASQIDPFVKQTKQIAVRVADTQMVYQLLSPQQQQQVGKIVEPNSAIRILRSKIVAARVKTLGDQKTSAPLTQEQQAELKHLDRLSGDLDEIDPTLKKKTSTSS